MFRLSYFCRLKVKVNHSSDTNVSIRERIEIDLFRALILILIFALLYTCVMPSLLTAQQLNSSEKKIIEKADSILNRLSKNYSNQSQPLGTTIVSEISGKSEEGPSVWAGTSNAGVWFFENNTWNHLSNSLGDIEVYNLQVNPFDPNVLIAVTDSGVYRTKDKGMNWTLVNMPFTQSGWKAVYWDRANFGDVVISGPDLGTVFDTDPRAAVSHDAGLSWIGIDLEIGDGMVAEARPGDVWGFAGSWYMMANSFHNIQLGWPYHRRAFWRSIDRGNTWELVGTWPREQWDVDRHVTGLWTDPNHIFGTFDHSYANPIIESNDAGTTWIKGSQYLHTQRQILADPVREDTLWLIAESNLYNSAEDINNFQLSHSGVRTVAIDGYEGIVYAGGDNRKMAYSLDAGKNWTRADIPLGGSAKDDTHILFLAAELGPVITPLLADTPWPMFRHDPRHTASSFYRGPGDAVKIMACNTQGEVNSSPAIGFDGNVYVGSDDGYFYAISPDNCTEIWKVPTGKITSSPAIASDGTIYVGSHDNNLYAISPNKTVKWKFPATAPIESSPVIGCNGIIYFCSNDGNIYAVNPRDGSKRWKHETSKEIISSPAVFSWPEIGQEFVYVFAKDGTLYDVSSNLNSPDMEVHYEQNDINYEISGSPAIWGNIENAYLYIGAKNGYLYRYQLSYSLTPIPAPNLFLSFPMGSAILSSPAVSSDGTTYVGCNDGIHYLTINYHYGLLHATQSPIQSSPAIDSHGNMYFGTDDGCFYFVDNYSKEMILLLQTSPNDPIISSPAIGYNEKIFVGSKNHKLYMFENAFLEEKQNLITNILNIERPISKFPIVGPWVNWKFFDPFFEKIEKETEDYVNVVSDKTKAGQASSKELQSVRRLVMSERVTMQATQQAVEFSEYWAKASIGFAVTLYCELVFYCLGKYLEGDLTNAAKRELTEFINRLDTRSTDNILLLLEQLKKSFNLTENIEFKAIEELYSNYLFWKAELLGLDVFEEISEFEVEVIINNLLTPIMQEIALAVYEYLSKPSQVNALEYAKDLNFQENTIIDDGLDTQHILIDMKLEGDNTKLLVDVNEFMQKFDSSTKVLNLLMGLSSLIINKPEIAVALLEIAEVLDLLATFTSLFTAGPASVSSLAFVIIRLPLIYVIPSVDQAFGKDTNIKRINLTSPTENNSIIINNNKKNVISNQKIINFFTQILTRIQNDDPSWSKTVSDSLKNYQILLDQNYAKTKADFMASFEGAKNSFKTYSELVNSYQMKSLATTLFSTSIELCAYLHQTGQASNNLKETAISSLEGIISDLSIAQEVQTSVYDSLQIYGVEIPTAVGVGSIHKRITNIQPAAVKLQAEIINYGIESAQGIHIFPKLVTEDASIIGDSLYTLDLAGGDTAFVEFNISSNKDIVAGMISVRTSQDNNNFYCIPFKDFFVDFRNASQPTSGPLNNENIYVYPNPFNPDLGNVKFRFSLSSPGNITIKVYDVSNRLVATVINNDQMEANEELSVPWNGKNDNGQIVANGVYFYIIESSSGERGVGKVAVLR